MVFECVYAYPDRFGRVGDPYPGVDGIGDAVEAEGGYNCYFCVGWFVSFFFFFSSFSFSPSYSLVVWLCRDEPEVVSRYSTAHR